jgi:hypothetical protein
LVIIGLTLWLASFFHAEAKLIAAARAQPEDETYRALWSFYARQHNYGRATAVFGRLARHNPDDAQAAYYLGLSYRRLGRFEEALDAYEEAIARADGLFPKAQYQAGWMYDLLSRRDESAAIVEPVLDALPDELQPDAHELLGRAAKFQNDPETAAAEFRHALQTETEPPAWWYGELQHVLTRTISITLSPREATVAMAAALPVDGAAAQQLLAGEWTASEAVGRLFGPLTLNWRTLALLPDSAFERSLRVKETAVWIEFQFTDGALFWFWEQRGRQQPDVLALTDFPLTFFDDAGTVEIMANGLAFKGCAPAPQQCDSRLARWEWTGEEEETAPYQAALTVSLGLDPLQSLWLIRLSDFRFQTVAFAILIMIPGWWALILWWRYRSSEVWPTGR